MITPQESSRIDAYVPSGVPVASLADETARPNEDEVRPLNAAPEPNPWARWMNIGVGTWLLVSAFLLPQSTASVANTAVVGLAVVVAAGVALFRNSARVVNVVLAPWLFVSTLVFTDATVARWSNGLAAFAVLLLALVPGSRRTSSGEPHYVGRGIR